MTCGQGAVRTDGRLLGEYLADLLRATGTSGRVSGGALSKMKLRKVCPAGPPGKLAHVEIERDQVRQQHVALLVAYREVIPRAVLEIADAGQMHVIANGKPPDHDTEKQHDA
jgi:hypothetical protein